MGGLLTAVVGAAVVAWGAPPPGEESAGRQEPLRLATPWPAADGCPSYSGVDISVDDRVGVVEWRGAGGASLVFDRVTLSGTRGDDEYRLGSAGTDCHEGQTTCIVYRRPVGRVLHVQATRASRGLPADFTPGTFDALVVHGDVRRRGFGLRLFLQCVDTAKPSVAWYCDGRACVPRTFRDDVKLQAFRKVEDAKPRRERRLWPPDEVPYWQRWFKGEPPKDLTALICMRGQAGLAEVEQAARAKNGSLLCRDSFAKRTPAAVARPMLVDLARDLLREMDLVLDRGCAGACSRRIDELRAVAAALAAADLRVIGVQAAFRDSHEEFGYGAYPSLGFIATLAARPGSIEVACAWHQTFTSEGQPTGEDCRLTVSAHGRRLADYTPNWGPFVELPDGGAVRVRDWLPSFDRYNHPRDQIVVIGSALATR